jgi:predicted ATPase
VLDAARTAHASQLVEIHLQPLTDEQCDTLIQNLLKTDRLPYATRALVLRKAEGNPFYIEEVIRSFVDAGAIEYRDGRFRLTAKIDTVEVPGTIQEVILARVDRLDESARYVLQVASVIGRSFHHRILAEVMEGAGTLDAELALLKVKQLIVERQTSGTAARRSTVQGELEYVASTS